MKAAKAKVENSDLWKEITEEQKKALQDALLAMYRDVLITCAKYNIIPYLCGGSALGAYRHKGFIPWDDDLDIAMTRNGFMKFESIFEKEFGDRYILNAPNYCKNAKARFPKIIKKNTVCQEFGSMKDDELNGIFLDIFIIDSVPDNPLLFKLKGTYCNLLEFIGACVYDYEFLDEAEKDFIKRTGSSMYYIRRAVGFVFHIRNHSYWFDRIDKAVSSTANTKRVGFVTGSKHYFGEVIEKSAITPYRKLQFCNINAPVFNDVEKYFENLYGKDYMKIPEEKDRVKHYIQELQL